MRGASWQLAVLAEAGRGDSGEADLAGAVVTPGEGIDVGMDSETDAAVGIGVGVGARVGAGLDIGIV
jgi:hypothetical protein